MASSRQIKVRRARAKSLRIWFPWYTVSCPCCGWSTVMFSWVAAMKTARHHSGLHTPAMEKVKRCSSNLLT